MRLIDADELFDRVGDIEPQHKYQYDDIGMFMNLITNSPTIERPHGEWIYKKFDKETGISDSYFCSRCNFPLTGIYKFYCAVCGADMRKEGDDA